MNKSELVVTGGSGFLGSYLVNALLNTNRITLIVRRKLDFKAEVQQLIVSKEQDFVFLQEKIPQRATFIHCAAAINATHTSEYWQANVVLTREMLEIAVSKKAKLFILFSTGGVYGYSDGKYAKESDKLEPIGVYGHTKLISEQVAAMYAKEHGLNIVVFRLYFPFAEGQKKGIFPLIKNSMIERKELTLNRNGSPRMQPVHCYDILSAVAKAIEKTPQGINVYNLCGDEVVSFGDIIKEYSEAADIEINTKNSDHDIGDLLADNALIKSELEWEPRVKCREFIRRDALSI